MLSEKMVGSECGGRCFACSGVEVIWKFFDACLKFFGSGLNLSSKPGHASSVRRLFL